MLEYLISLQEYQVTQHSQGGQGAQGTQEVQQYQPIQVTNQKFFSVPVQELLRSISKLNLNEAPTRCI
jgi:hypothetical protein